MKFTFTLFVALSLVSMTFACQCRYPPCPCQRPCYTRCRFRFCDGTTRINPKLYPSDTPFKGRLCDKYRRIHLGTVDESGEAYVVGRYGRRIPISRFSPYGLKQNFSPSFFKTFSVRGYYRTWYGKKYYNPYLNYGRYTPHKYSSVGAETSQQGQIEYLNNRCIVLPFKKYQVLDKPGRNVIANVNTNKLHDCVAFEVDLYKWWKTHKKQGKKYQGYSDMEAEKPKGDKKQEEKYEESSDMEAEKPEEDKKQEKKYEDYSDTEAEEPEGNKKEEKKYEEYSEMEAEKPEEKKYEYQ